MIKRKTFYGSIYNPESQAKFDGNVNDFIEKISKEESLIIHYNTFSYNALSSNGFYQIRTEIVYKETPTREVIFEKYKDAKN